MTLATRAWRQPFLPELRMVDDLFNRVFGTGVDRVTGWTPVLDIRESEDEFLVLVDLPGVKSDDVSVELDDTVLTISGARAPYETGEGRLVERPFGSFVRSLTLPKGVDADRIVADYHDGVLELHVPKPAEYRPRKIALNTNGGRKALSS
jgi:HSP20 family protein